MSTHDQNHTCDDVPCCVESNAAPTSSSETSNTRLSPLRVQEGVQTPALSFAGQKRMRSRSMAQCLTNPEEHNQEIEGRIITGMKTLKTEGERRACKAIDNALLDGTNACLLWCDALQSLKVNETKIYCEFSDMERELAMPLVSEVNDDIKGDLPSSQAIAVVIGSYNSGKSALLNAVLGESLLKCAAVEQTQEVWAITRPSVLVDASLTHVVSSLVTTTSNNALRQITLLDTPGYNGLDCDVTLLKRLLPVCQIILFCISSQSPVTAQDASMASSIAGHGRHIIVLLTKSDLSRNESELSSVVLSVKSRLAPALGYSPKVLAVAASPASLSSPGSNMHEHNTFEFSKFMQQLHSMDANPFLLRASLLRSAHNRLQTSTTNSLSRVRVIHAALTQSIDACRKAITLLDHVADELNRELHICQQRIRQQGHELLDAPASMSLLRNLHSEAALSAPLSALRKHIKHATHTCENQIQDMIPRVHQNSSDNELRRFHTLSSDILRAAEADIDEAALEEKRDNQNDDYRSNSDDDDVDKDYNQHGRRLPSLNASQSYSGGSSRNSATVSTVSSSTVSTATASAAGLVVGAALGPVVGVCTAAIGLASSLSVRYRRLNQDTEIRTAAQRRLLVQPGFSLQLVADNINRFRSRAKEPLLSHMLKISEKQRIFDNAVTHIERLQRECGRDIKVAAQDFDEAARTNHQDMIL